VTYDYVGGFTRDWLSAGVIDKAWYLAVFVACAVAVVRGLRVGRHVFRPRTRRRPLSELIGDSSLGPDEIASLGLAGAVVSSGDHATLQTPELTPGAQRRLDAAQARFTYRWQLAEARVAATRGLLGAALLITVLGSAGSVPALVDQEFGHGGYVWSTVMVVSRMGLRLSIMLSQCLVICVVWSTLDVALRRRRAAWQYSVSTLRNGAGAAI
jgi:hypothetical protein